MKVRDCVFPDCDCPNRNAECLFTPSTYDKYVQRMNEQNRKDELFQARITWFVFGVVMGVAMSSTIYFFSIYDYSLGSLFAVSTLLFAIALLNTK